MTGPEIIANRSVSSARPLFPFTAIVGQDAMKRALIFNAIDPSIGGVLISGTRGTAKSTAVRALAALLPEMEVVAGDPFNSTPDRNPHHTAVRVATPFVNLPIGATEDRVLGTLDPLFFGLLVGAGAVVARELPSIQRYMKMRAM